MKYIEMSFNTMLQVETYADALQYFIPTIDDSAYKLAGSNPFWPLTRNIIIKSPTLITDCINLQRIINEAATTPIVLLAVCDYSLIWTPNLEHKIHAGCRRFASIEAAIQHWTHREKTVMRDEFALRAAIFLDALQRLQYHLNYMQIDTAFFYYTSVVLDDSGRES